MSKVFSKMNRAPRALWMFGSVCLLAGVLVGCWFQGEGLHADKVEYKELEKFSKVLQLIESDYVESQKARELIEGAIRGMLQGLDPHSSYMNPEVFREMKVETSGKFGGLGIEVTLKGGIITVVSPIDDTPAHRAGIKRGDRIVRIEGRTTKDMTLPEAVSMMRGKPGTSIHISVIRAGVDKMLEFDLKRESIKIQSVRWSALPSGVGYVRIASFMERTSDELVKALEKLGAAKDLKGVILDLRGNPGGLLDQAVKVSNLFIDEGPVVYTIGRDRSKKDTEFAQKGRKKTDAPLVVLVDGASASASEIVAGALQDYGRGVIAGQRTFGKGSVQTIIPLGDDSGLKLTVARYYTPSGRSIQAKGIEPDVELEEIDSKSLEAARQRSKTFREADLEGHFENESDESSDGETGAADGKAKAEGTATKTDKDDVLLSLEERLKKDYMVVQAQGILRTMAVVQRGLKQPEFRLEDETKKPEGKPANPRKDRKKTKGL